MVKKNSVSMWLLGLACVAGLIAAASVWASEQSIHGGGGEIPTPFEAMNQFVELADGEEYMLVGVVQLRSNNSSFGPAYRASFQVDLEQSPWLANAKRKAHPYYILQGASSFWKQYEGKRVRLPVTARGTILSSPSGQASYEIELSYGHGKGSEPGLLPIELCMRSSGACY